LNLELAVAVQARRGLVQDQDARVRQDRARDCDALALAAGEPDAALADHRVVFQLERVNELVAVRDAAHFAHLLHRGVRLAVADVVGDRPVEQEVLLQHDPELRAVVRQAQVREVVAVDPDHPAGRSIERHHEADERALARPARPDQRRRGAGRRRK